MVDCLAGVQRFGSAVVSQVQRDEVRSRPEGFPWRLVAAICVIRFPTLSREKTELEQRFEEMQAQKETERSVLSQYELERIRRTEEQRQYEEKTAEGEELDFEAERQRTAQQGRYEETDEIRELEEQEALSFQPASWADVNDDRHSLDRRLRDTLYLLVKKPRSGHAWQMPQGGHEGSESLRQTAQRELREECGSNVRVKFAGNVPCGFFGYRFPADHKPLDGMIGAKASYQSRGV